MVSGRAVGGRAGDRDERPDVDYATLLLVYTN